MATDTQVYQEIRKHPEMLLEVILPTVDRKMFDVFRHQLEDDHEVTHLTPSETVKLIELMHRAQGKEDWIGYVEERLYTIRPHAPGVGVVGACKTGFEMIRGMCSPRRRGRFERTHIRLRRSPSREDVPTYFNAEIARNMLRVGKHQRDRSPSPVGRRSSRSPVGRRGRSTSPYRAHRFRVAKRSRSGERRTTKRRTTKSKRSKSTSRSRSDRSKSASRSRKSKSKRSHKRAARR